MSNITKELLHELLDYDAETGKLKWKPRGPHLFKDDADRTSESRCKWWNSRFAGKEAGRWKDPNGYHACKLLNKNYRNHRVIWMMATGEWPQNIDHIDGDPGNNRWSNLRNASYSDNNQNKAMQANNTSGVVGVSWLPHVRKWGARIGGKQKHLGYFGNFEDAVKARRDEEELRGYHVNHGRVS